MSQTFSRREFFAHLTNPWTTLARSITADEQRRRNLRALKPSEGERQCARCYLPFQPEAEETLCPACRAAEAKSREMMQALFK